MTSKPVVSMFLSAVSASYEKQELVSVKSDGKGKVSKTGRDAVSSVSEKALKGDAPPPAGFGEKQAPIIALAVAQEPLGNQEFLLLIRDAGKRKSPEGRPIFDSDGEKQDQKAALARFGGYSPGEPLGVQLDNAVRRARNALKLGGTGYASQGEKRSALRGVEGYIKGGVDAAATRKADLERRFAHARDASFILEAAIDAAASGGRLEGDLLKRLREHSPELAPLCEAHGASVEALSEARRVELARAENIGRDLACL